MRTLRLSPHSLPYSLSSFNRNCGISLLWAHTGDSFLRYLKACLYLRKVSSLEVQRLKGLHAELIELLRDVVGVTTYLN